MDGSGRSGEDQGPALLRPDYACRAREQVPETVRAATAGGISASTHLGNLPALGRNSGRSLAIRHEMQEILHAAGQLSGNAGTVEGAIRLAARVTGLSFARTWAMWYLQVNAWAHEADHLRDWQRRQRERQARRLQAQCEAIAALDAARNRYDIDALCAGLVTVDRRRPRVGQAPYAGVERRINA